MINLILLTLAITLTGPSSAMEPVADYAPPAPAGISFEEIHKLGRRTEAELINRFSDPRNKQYRNGLIQRMAVFGNLKKPSPLIFKGLKTFVEKEVADCTGSVESDRIWIIGSALELIGQRGGAPGSDYLKTWVRDESVFGRIKCYAPKREAADSQEQLRTRAVTGLGWSGTKESMEFLSWVGSHPPVVKFPGSFMGVLNGAVDLNTKVQKNGIESQIKEGRESMLGYGKYPEYDK